MIRYTGRSGDGQSNVMAECLALLLRIQEVPGSNLGPKTDCPDLGFRGFPLSPNILSSSQIVLSFDAVLSELLAVSLNKSQETNPWSRVLGKLIVGYS
jgi:hypothetical protein